jgi:hypothetical protein
MGKGGGSHHIPGTSCCMDRMSETGSCNSQSPGFRGRQGTAGNTDRDSSEGKQGRLAMRYAANDAGGDSGSSPISHLNDARYPSAARVSARPPAPGPAKAGSIAVSASPNSIAALAHDPGQPRKLRGSAGGQINLPGRVVRPWLRPWSVRAIPTTYRNRA